MFKLPTDVLNYMFSFCIGIKTDELITDDRSALSRYLGTNVYGTCAPIRSAKPFDVFPLRRVSKNMLGVIEKYLSVTYPGIFHFQRRMKH